MISENQSEQNNNKTSKQNSNVLYSAARLGLNLASIYFIVDHYLKAIIPSVASSIALEKGLKYESKIKNYTENMILNLTNVLNGSVKSYEGIHLNSNYHASKTFDFLARDIKEFKPYNSSALGLNMSDIGKKILDNIDKINALPCAESVFYPYGDKTDPSWLSLDCAVPNRFDVSGDNQPLDWINMFGPSGLKKEYNFEKEFLDFTSGKIMPLCKIIESAGDTFKDFYLLNLELERNFLLERQEKISELKERVIDIFNTLSGSSSESFNRLKAEVSKYADEKLGNVSQTLSVFQNKTDAISSVASNVIGESGLDSRVEHANATIINQMYVEYAYSILLLFYVLCEKLRQNKELPQPDIENGLVPNSSVCTKIKDNSFVKAMSVFVTASIIKLCILEMLIFYSKNALSYFANLEPIKNYDKNADLQKANDEFVSMFKPIVFMFLVNVAFPLCEKVVTKKMSGLDPKITDIDVDLDRSLGYNFKSFCDGVTEVKARLADWFKTKSTENNTQSEIEEIELIKSNPFGGASQHNML